MQYDTVKSTAFIALTAINAAGLIIAALDKLKSRKGMWRIPERAFFFIALLGGCPGVFAGLLLFKHKTRRPGFMLGIPLIFAAQLFIIYLLFR
ncbi:MAG: DUF1294 domain-containing protein [Clostridia bacterium]|nr:DUF1294 domain-containing protein [Clostridia bacterium]